MKMKPPLVRALNRVYQVLYWVLILIPSLFMCFSVYSYYIIKSLVGVDLFDDFYVYKFVTERHIKLEILPWEHGSIALNCYMISLLFFLSLIHI